MIPITDIPFGVVALIALWTIPWKGWALWLSARRGEKWWFIILLLLNTLAILEIIYIFAVAKKKDRKEISSVSENSESNT